MPEHVKKVGLVKLTSRKPVDFNGLDPKNRNAHGYDPKDSARVNFDYVGPMSFDVEKLHNLDYIAYVHKNEIVFVVRKTGHVPVTYPDGKVQHQVLGVVAESIDEGSMLVGLKVKASRNGVTIKEFNFRLGVEA